VADIHQPLHAQDNDDKGGNQVRVVLGRERANLHRIWDADVVDVQGRDPAIAASAILRGISPAQHSAWASGTPVQWANEAHALARDQIYPPLSGRRELRLPRDYAWRQAGLARMQLARAGIRLAWLLNSTLK
jgi:nuclease S1